MDLSASYTNVRITDGTGVQGFCNWQENWLFSDRPVGAATSAIIYSLVQTAKLNGVNPYYYLRYVLEKMSSYPTCDKLSEQDLAGLMPWSGKVGDAIREYEKEKDRFS